MSIVNSKALFMKIIEKTQLDFFLELPLIASSLLEINRTYKRIHDDNDGCSDQCLKITLIRDSIGNEVFHFRTPINTALRFRTWHGGGASLPVHNAVKVLIYAILKPDELFLPGFERDDITPTEITQTVEEILNEKIILPEIVFSKKSNSSHYFFNLTSCVQLAISVDSDVHIITEINTEVSKIHKQETTFWNPDPIIFNPISNCSRAIYNALILLAQSTTMSNH